jgi:hypothetical protein
LTLRQSADRAAEIDVWLENADAERLVIGTATVQFPVD